MKTILVRQPGGPERMELAEVPVPKPGAKQALVRIHAAGVNFLDVYQRTGLYPGATPFTLGNEGAGIVEALGPEVTEVAVGDRVAYAMQRGSYAEYAVVGTQHLVKIPDGLAFETAAAAMLQGMTAHYLTHSTHPLTASETCLVHAAAGGTGGLIVQLAKIRGARVFGTVSTEQKARIAQGHGADETILYTSQDFEVETKRLTGGRGVDVVYDSVGKATFAQSLGCLRPRGLLVSFGQSSGPVGPIDPVVLSQKGSLFLTRPTLAHHLLTREEVLFRANDVLGWVASGRLKLRIERIYPLDEATQAHRDLEGRKLSGKLVLKVA
jgi:NADPH2:quinone reductase